jgi:hypothetical protein
MKRFQPAFRWPNGKFGTAPGGIFDRFSCFDLRDRQ